MKKHLILSACLIMAISSFAQKKDFSYKFYGQIRTDLYYNSRANEETVDGLSMQPVEEIKAPVLVAMAVYIGKTRLIDNFIVE